MTSVAFYSGRTFYFDHTLRHFKFYIDVQDLISNIFFTYTFEKNRENLRVTSHNTTNAGCLHEICGYVKQDSFKSLADILQIFPDFLER
jgi:hypothetical protein